MEYTLIQNFNKKEIKEIYKFIRDNNKYSSIFLTDLWVKSLWLAIGNLVCSLISIPKISYICLVLSVILVILFFLTLFFFEQKIPYVFIKHCVKKSNIINLSDTYFRKGNKKILFEKTVKYTADHPKYIFIYMRSDLYESSNIFVLKKNLIPNDIKEIINKIFPSKKVYSMKEQFITQCFTDYEIEEFIKDVRKDKVMSGYFINSTFVIFRYYVIIGALLILLFTLIKIKILLFLFSIFTFISLFICIFTYFILIRKVPKFLIKYHLDLCKELYISDNIIEIQKFRINIDNINLYLTSHPKYIFLLCNPTRIIPSVLILKKDKLSEESYELLIKWLDENRKNFLNKKIVKISKNGS